MLQNALRRLHDCCMGFVLGKGQSTKPFVFPCTVAAAGDERYLGCAAVAGALVSRRNLFSLGVLHHVDASRIVVAAWMCGWCCKTYCSGCMIVAWALFRGSTL